MTDDDDATVDPSGIEPVQIRDECTPPVTEVLGWSISGDVLAIETQRSGVFLDGDGALYSS